MNLFKNVQIKWQIIGLVMLVSTMSLLLANAGFLVFARFQHKRVMVHNLSSEIKIVGINSIAPLEFNDPALGREILQALKVVPEILVAGVYRKDGGLFISYAREGHKETVFPSKPKVDGVYFDGGKVYIFDSIFFKGEKAGTIYLLAEMRQLEEALKEFGLISMAVFLILLPMSFALAMKLQIGISGPIKKLKGAAEKFGQGQLDERIEIESDDEVGDLAKSFIKMRQDMKATQEKLMHAEKLSALGKLTSSIAHEFNNPITGLRNILEQIGEESPHMEAELKSLLSLGVKECYRMAELVQKLRDFYKPPHEEIYTMVDIHNVLDETILLLQKRLQERNIQLVKNYASNLPKIEVVEDEIKQVLLNLIRNAEEAMNGERGEITVSTEFRKPHVRILVQDTGEGIPENIFQLIFDPFFTTKSAIKGTGLGLSVSHGIIKKHKGGIHVQSQVGRGTVFTVTLPVKQ